MILEQENIVLKHAGIVSSQVTCISLNTKLFENKSPCTAPLPPPLEVLCILRKKY